MEDRITEHFFCSSKEAQQPNSNCCYKIYASIALAFFRRVSLVPLSAQSSTSALHWIMFFLDFHVSNIRLSEFWDYIFL